VKLAGSAGVRTAAYSGGMRRRLSVAIALLGDPLVVYLDEPTTVSGDVRKAREEGKTEIYTCVHPMITS
jgi:ABC-type glutathione transport system ATPase component